MTPLDSYLRFAPRSMRIAVLTFATMAAIPAIALAQNTQADPPGRVARVSAAAGAVSLLAVGDSDWVSAPVNYTVTSGDRLNTGLNSRAELEVGSLAIRLGEATDVDITNLSDHLAQIGVSRGVLRLSVYRLLPNDVIQLDTPAGAVTIRALGHYRVTVGENHLTTVVVDNGAVDINTRRGEQTLRSGQALELVSGGMWDGDTRRVGRPTVDGFDRWSADRDRRQLAASCGAYMSRDIPGCADLDEHGRWDTDATHGTIWYPSQVHVDWVPYRHGHWTHTTRWGWVWVEDEPWGFAPFHYGRWVHTHSRWGWVPGPIVARPFYSPALVAWVGGPHVGVGISVGWQAWFPLGPHEYYYPSYRYYGDRYFQQINITNIRNVTYVVPSRNTVYVNKNVGLTAVPQTTFHGRRAVAREVIQVAGRPGYATGDVSTTPSVQGPRPVVGAPRRPPAARATPSAPSSADVRTGTTSPPAQGRDAPRAATPTRAVPASERPRTSGGPGTSRADEARPPAREPSAPPAVQSRPGSSTQAVERRVITPVQRDSRPAQAAPAPPQSRSAQSSPPVQSRAPQTSSAPRSQASPPSSGSSRPTAAPPAKSSGGAVIGRKPRGGG